MTGELAKMVERPLCVRKVPGSMPGFSTFFFFSFFRYLAGSNRVRKHNARPGTLSYSSKVTGQSSRFKSWEIFLSVPGTLTAAAKDINNLTE